MKVRILTESDCRAVLTMAEAIDLQEQAFSMLANAQAVEGLRSYAISDDPPGTAIFNPCFLTEGKGYGVKIVSDFYGNQEPEVPRMSATMTLMDGTTGHPHTFMEAGYLTDLRTGAGSGLAAKFLANPGTDQLAVIGAGRVARYQILALAEVLPITQIRISTRTRSRGESLIASLQEEVDARLELVDSPRVAIEGAGAVIAATTSAAPVIPGALLEPGSFVVSAGSHGPDRRELDTDVIRRSDLMVIDSRSDCLADAGDFVITADEGIISLDDVQDIGDIIVGSAPRRRTASEITVYKSIGVPIQDLITAQAIADRATEAGLGVEMELNP